RSARRRAGTDRRHRISARRSGGSKRGFRLLLRRRNSPPRRRRPAQKPFRGGLHVGRAFYLRPLLTRALGSFSFAIGVVRVKIGTSAWVAACRPFQSREIDTVLIV